MDAFSIVYLTCTAVLAVTEVLALIDKRKGNTISEKSRKVLGTEGVKLNKKFKWTVRTIAFTVFMVWFYNHIMFNFL